MWLIIQKDIVDMHDVMRDLGVMVTSQGESVGEIYMLS